MVRGYLLTALVAFFLIDSWFIIHAITETIGNVYVVTKFAKLSDIYEKLRPQNPQNESKLSEFDKDRLCGQIFGSKEVLNPAEEEYETKLKTYNYALYKQLFKPVEIPKSVSSRMTFRNKRVKHKYVFDNSSKPRTFLVGGNERKETTFVCAVRKFGYVETWMDIYFVSDYGYNVNELEDGETILGRFVFFDNKIYGLAEERPVVSRQVRWTDYNTRRNRYEVAEKWENDPVCKLDSARKIRLCTYVCAQTDEKKCADRVIVQEPCERREFTWRNESYDGWMLNCTTTNRNPLFGDAPPTYYVAHTYFNNEAFVFKEGLEGELHFRFKLKKVPVVAQEQMAD